MSLIVRNFFWFIFYCNNLLILTGYSDYGHQSIYAWTRFLWSEMRE